MTTPRGNPVTLLSGAVVDSWSPAWLDECRDRELAARDIIRLADPEQGYRLHVARLAPPGVAEECERRLRAAVADLWVRQRLAFEAEAVLNLSYREDRLAYVAAVGERHGPAAADALRARVLALWNERREAATPSPTTADAAPSP